MQDERLSDRSLEEIMVMAFSDIAFQRCMLQFLPNNNEFRFFVSHLWSAVSEKTA